MDNDALVLCVGFKLPDDCKAPFKSASVMCQRSAVGFLDHAMADVVVVDLDKTVGSPLAVADFAAFRRPEARVILVSAVPQGSDRPLFAHWTNLRAHVPSDMAPDALTALIAEQCRTAQVAAGASLRHAS